MNKTEVMSILYDYCRLANNECIRQLLDQYPNEVDIFDDNGDLLNVVIERGFASTLTILLDFYTATRLQGPEDSLEYRQAYHMLQTMLQSVCGQSASEEIQAIVAKYLYDFDDSIVEEVSSHTEQEKVDDEVLQQVGVQSAIKLTEEVLVKWNHLYPTEIQDSAAGSSTKINSWSQESCISHDRQKNVDFARIHEWSVVHHIAVGQDIVEEVCGLIEENRLIGNDGDAKYTDEEIETALAAIREGNKSFEGYLRIQMQVMILVLYIAMTKNVNF